jgi:hypothetical protein
VESFVVLDDIVNWTREFRSRVVVTNDQIGLYYHDVWTALEVLALPVG